MLDYCSTSGAYAVCYVYQAAITLLLYITVMGGGGGVLPYMGFIGRSIEIREFGSRIGYLLQQRQNVCSNNLEA